MAARGAALAGRGAAVVGAWAARLAVGLVFVLSEAGARLLGAPRLRRLYQAWLAGVVLLGPLLRPLADPHGLLANPRSFLSRTFGASAWGWTCLLAGGFGLVTSYGAMGRPLAPLRPLARLAVGGALQWGAGAALALLDAPPSPCPPAPRPPPGDPHWGGPAAAAFRLTHGCLVLAAELAPFRPYLARGPAGAPLRLLFLLGLALLGLLSLQLLGLALHGPTPAPPSPTPAPQALGAALATAAWRLTYGGWYRARRSPGRPGAWGAPRSAP